LPQFVRKLTKAFLKYIKIINISIYKVYIECNFNQIEQRSPAVSAARRCHKRLQIDMFRGAISYVRQRSYIKSNVKRKCSNENQLKRGPHTGTERGREREREREREGEGDRLPFQ